MRFVGNPYRVRPPFREILEEGLYGRSMLDTRKLRILHELCIVAGLMPGNVAEAGVYAGGVMYLFASMLPEKVVHGFDSWEGLPDLVDQDKMPDGKFAGMKGQFKTDMPSDFLQKFDNVVLHRGWFKDTLPEVSDERFCLVHIDCDVYTSAMDCLEFFTPRMVDGGYMVFDDYSFWGTPGVTAAVDEFFEGQDIEYYTNCSAILRIRSKDA